MSGMRAEAPKRRRGASIGFLLGVLLSAGSALGEPSGPTAPTPAARVAAASAQYRHPLDNLELDGLRSSRPQAIAALEQGEAAILVGDWFRAEALFRQAAAAAPESTLIPRRLCQVLTELGRRDEALPHCRRATANGTAMDGRALVGA